MLEPPPPTDRFVPGTPRLDSFPSAPVGISSPLSPSRSRSAGLRHATSMFGLRSLQNLRLHHSRKSSVYEDHKENSLPLEVSRVAPPWLDRDTGELSRPQTSPLEYRAGAFASASCNGSAGVVVEARHRIRRKSTASDHALYLRHRQRKTTACIETMLRDGSSLVPDMTAASNTDKLTKIADDTGVKNVVESRELSNDDTVDKNTTDTRGRRGREWHRKGSVRLHPGPLNSHPTRDAEDTTPRATTSFTAEMQARLNDIRGSLINRIGRPASRWWEDDGSGSRLRRSLTPPTPRVEQVEPPTPSSMPATPVLRASAVFDEPELFVHQQLADLKSENITLKSLKRLHEEAIGSLREEKLTLGEKKTALEATVSESESKICAQQATLGHQDATISKLSRQLSSRDAEQAALVANFATELASRDNELIALKDEKWTLQRKVTELEQMIAQTEAQLQQWGRMGRRIPRKLKVSSVSDGEGDVSAAFGPGSDTNSADDRAGQSGTDSHIDTNSVTDNGLMILDTSTAGSPKSRLGEISSPNSSFHSPFTPGTSPSSSLSGWTATTSTRSVRPLFSFQSTPTPNISMPDNALMNSATSTSGGTRPSSRRRRSLSSQTTAVAMAEDETLTTAWRPPTSHDQTNQRGQVGAAQQRAWTAENPGLERAFMSRLNKQVSLNELNLLGSVKGVSRMASVEKSIRASPSSPVLPSLSTPELPALTYGRSLTVWLDRVVTTFKYLNLSSFLRSSDIVTTNTSERLRAAIILKNAVNDDILEDVLFLLSRKETQSNTASTEPANSASECPHLLLSAILTIHGLVSGSPSEVGWVDRISEAELGGVEDFANLVLCIDKRRSTMFGTTTEHYDGILPRIQESVAQRSPEVDQPLHSEAAVSTWPKKKSQLTSWMGGLVKRRQTRLESERVDL